MRRVHQIIGVSFLLVAALLGFNATTLGYYTRLGPGPGFFPLWLSIILAALSVAILARSFALSPAGLPPGFFADRASYLRIAGVMVVLMAAAFGMRWLGFRWTMLAFYLLLLPGLGRRNPVEIVLLALLGSFGAYWVFVVNLGLALPIGPFGI